MKVNAKDLFEVVRSVVRDEIKKVLPEMIKEQLAENYVKKIVKESISNDKKSSISELLTTETEEEVVPKPKKNLDRGIYNPENPELIGNESVNKLLSKENPLAFVYESVEVPKESASSAQDPVLPQLDFQKMQRLVEQTDAAVASRRTMSVSPEAKMRELEMKRRELDSKKL